LFETLWKASHPEEELEEEPEPAADEEAKPEEPQTKKRVGHQPLARHLVRERIIHDLAESEKYCEGCGQHLRLIAEETSERYEFIPAVIEDVRLKYACDCTVKQRTNRAADWHSWCECVGAGDRLQVCRSSAAAPAGEDFARHGVEISRKTMGGWLPPVAGLLSLSGSQESV
jgi:transposase